MYFYRGIKCCLRLTTSFSIIDSSSGAKVGVVVVKDEVKNVDGVVDKCAEIKKSEENSGNEHKEINIRKPRE